MPPKAKKAKIEKRRLSREMITDTQGSDDDASEGGDKSSDSESFEEADGGQSSGDEGEKSDDTEVTEQRGKTRKTKTPSKKPDAKNEVRLRYSITKVNP